MILFNVLSYVQISILTQHLHSTNEDLMMTQKQAEALELGTLPQLFQTSTPKTFASKIPGLWQTSKHRVSKLKER